MTVCSGTNAGTYFYCYDGNGNVVALVNAANGSIAAQYAYGLMDDVMIFNRRLSDDEIRTLFESQGGVLPPEPAKASPAAPAAKPDAATRLKAVKALLDQGLINKEDYDKKVKEIMDAL